MNNDIKQFIANGIALKFGEMATSLVKTMKFQPEGGEQSWGQKQDTVDEQLGPSKNLHEKTAQLMGYVEAVEDGDAPVESLKNAQTAVRDAMNEYSEAQGLGVEYGKGSPQQGDDLYNIAEAIEAKPDGVNARNQMAKMDNIYATRKARIETEIHGESEGDPLFPDEVDDFTPGGDTATEGGGESGEDGDALTRQQWAHTAENAEKDYADALDSFRKGELDESELNRASEWAKETAAYARGEDSPATEGGGEAAQDEPKKKSDRCETGTRKDPKTGQCKPHQARQTMNDNVKMYIANGIAMRFGRAAKKMLRTMKFQPDPEGLTWNRENAGSDGDIRRAANQIVPELSGINLWGISGQVVDEQEAYRAGQFDRIGTGLNRDGEDLNQAEAAQELNVLSDRLDAGIEAYENHFGEDDFSGMANDIANDASDPSHMDTYAEMSQIHHSRSEEEGGSGGEGKLDAEVGEYEQAHADELDEMEARAEAEGGDDEIGDEERALIDADKAFNRMQQLEDHLQSPAGKADIREGDTKALEEYKSIRAGLGYEPDAPIGDRTEAGKKDDRPSGKSDRCETGTHKDPKTGQCKPI